MKRVKFWTLRRSTGSTYKIENQANKNHIKPIKTKPKTLVLTMTKMNTSVVMETMSLIVLRFRVFVEKAALAKYSSAGITRINNMLL